eukprot:SAG31_NODE_47073_length_251_cov_2.046053_1_plen_48_part_01
MLRRMNLVSKGNPNSISDIKLTIFEVLLRTGPNRAEVAAILPGDKVLS